MTRYDTEALRAEAREIEARIAGLVRERSECRIVKAIAKRYRNDVVEEEQSLRIDVIGDELGPLRSRLDEIEEDLGWAEAAEERRETPIRL